MQRQFARFLVLLTCVASAAAQPRIAVQDSVNWGIVVPEQKLGEVTSVYQDVVVSNTGNAELVITDIHPGCGCTTAPIDKKTLAPGESTTIHVGLNLPNTNGELHKTVSISSNDTVTPVKVLHLLANVQRPLQLSDGIVPFNRGSVGDTIVGQLTVSVYGAEPVTIEPQVFQSKLILLTPSRIVLMPGEKHTIKVGYIPEKQGAFSIQLLVKTSLKGYESFDLKGYGVVDPRTD